MLWPNRAPKRLANKRSLFENLWHVWREDAQSARPNSAKTMPFAFSSSLTRASRVLSASDANACPATLDDSANWVRRFRTWIYIVQQSWISMIGLGWNLTENPCEPDPCKNNATCVISGPTDYRCLCHTGFGRQELWRPGNGLADEPLWHVSARIHAWMAAFVTKMALEGFYCTCPPMYQGRSCQQFANPCYK